MPKDDLVYVGHMLDMARQIAANAAGLDRSGFDADEILQLAVVHLIQTIGEAARLVSDDLKSAHPDVPWRQITGMRHRIVHDYLQVDFDVVWGVVQNDVAPLIQQLEQLVRDDREDS